MKHSLSFLFGAVIGAQLLTNGVASLLEPQGSGFFNHLPNVSLIASAHAEEAEAVKYTCPMHHQIIADAPGKCPICGMDLVPISGNTHDHASSAAPGGAPIIEIAAETIQKMGVRTAKVTKAAFSTHIRATGIVMENERARWDMFSQVEGRIDDLNYSAPGDRVKKGDLFYTLYSPELLTLQNDYIAALKGGYKDLANSAAKRMKLLGVDSTFLQTLAKTKIPYESVPFIIPADGILNKLEIRKGHYLKVNDEIGHILDLSTVWVEAALSEKDLGAIKEGDAADVTFTGNAHPYIGKVDYIYPTINPESRTGKVRLVVDNKDGLLRPASYATVAFASGSTEEQLTVPSEAILRSNDGEHVILALGAGKFQSRSIQSGAINAGRTIITSGLQEGDDVVTSAQFLIDSESSLRESFNKMDMPVESAPKEQSLPPPKSLDAPPANTMEMDHGH